MFPGLPSSQGDAGQAGNDLGLGEAERGPKGADLGGGGTAGAGMLETMARQSAVSRTVVVIAPVHAELTPLLRTWIDADPSDGLMMNAASDPTTVSPVIAPLPITISPPNR